MVPVVAPMIVRYVSNVLPFHALPCLCFDSSSLPLSVVSFGVGFRFRFRRSSGTRFLLRVANSFDPPSAFIRSFLALSAPAWPPGFFPSRRRTRSVAYLLIPSPKNFRLVPLFFHLTPISSTFVTTLVLRSRLLLCPGNLGVGMIDKGVDRVAPSGDIDRCGF